MPCGTLPVTPPSPPQVGRAARRGRAFRDEPAGQIHGGSSRPEGSDSRDRDLGEMVTALCGAAEQLRFVFGRVARGQKFERAPRGGIARTDAVRWEIALEHAAVGAEHGDAGLDIRLIGARQLLRRRRRLQGPRGRDLG
jgi:hypothetical protein